MLLNFGKCKCLHTGNGNLDINYKMGDTVLGTTAVSKGNQILGLIRKNITYKDKSVGEHENQEYCQMFPCLEAFERKCKSRHLSFDLHLSIFM